jgi:transposase InsO family protein
MIIPLLTLIRVFRVQSGVNIESVYRYVGVSRQSYFQAKQRQEAQMEMMHQIEGLVREYRANKDRRAGSRSLYYNLSIKEKYNIGVNKFEGLMSEYGLTLAPLRLRIVTTKSCLQSWNYPDLTPGLVLRDINQLVVGDLTYVKIGRYMYYLFCLTDLYSARIVGYHLGRRMRAKEAKEALDQWFKLRGKSSLDECIHHTDGGTQYFSTIYLESMKGINLQISVAKNCLDNGYAEQRNGFVKHHLIPTLKLVQTDRLLYKEFDKMIYFYNYERKQEDLGWFSPVEYEKNWQDKGSRPMLKIYDRSKGKNSQRGFLKA